MSAISDTQDTKVGVEPGGDRGFVKNGAAFDIEAGGALKLAGVDVTAALARVADLSTREVNAAAAMLAVTAAAHDGRTVLLNRAAGLTATLPASTGSGARFRFVVAAVPSAGASVIQVANSSDIIQGTLGMLSDDGAGGPVKGFSAGAADDTISLNGTTTGGLKKGDWIDIEDVAANLWVARGMLSASGAEVSPFSSAV